MAGAALLSAFPGGGAGSSASRLCVGSGFVLSSFVRLSSGAAGRNKEEISKRRVWCRAETEQDSMLPAPDACADQGAAKSSLVS